MFMEAGAKINISRQQTKQKPRLKLDVEKEDATYIFRMFFQLKKHSQDIANDAAQPIGKHPEEQDDKDETNPCTCISEAL